MRNIEPTCQKRLNFVQVTVFFSIEKYECVNEYPKISEK